MSATFKPLKYPAADRLYDRRRCNASVPVRHDRRSPAQGGGAWVSRGGR